MKVREEHFIQKSSELKSLIGKALRSRTILSLSPPRHSVEDLAFVPIRVLRFPEGEKELTEALVWRYGRPYIAIDFWIVERSLHAALQFTVHGLFHLFSYFDSPGTEYGYFWEEGFCELGAYRSLEQILRPSERDVMEVVKNISNTTYTKAYEILLEAEIRIPGILVETNRKIFFANQRATGIKERVRRIRELEEELLRRLEFIGISRQTISLLNDELPYDVNIPALRGVDLETGFIQI